MNIVNTIKKAAIEAVEQSNPADLVIGTVTQVEPLVIKINQRLEIPKEFILLTDNVRNYSLDININHQTDNETASGDSHNHMITGSTTLEVKNALKVNEKVVMSKSKGGQQYIVLNRVVEA